MAPAPANGPGRPSSTSCGGGQVRAERGLAGGVPGAAVDRLAEHAAAGAAEQPPSGVVPNACRCWPSMHTRIGGMGMTRTVPSGRCLRPRDSNGVPVLVQVAPVRGQAAVRIIVPRPRAGRPGAGDQGQDRPDLRRTGHGSRAEGHGGSGCAPAHQADGVGGQQPELDHVAQDQHSPLTWWQQLNRRQEGQRDRLPAHRHRHRHRLRGPAGRRSARPAASPGTAAPTASWRWMAAGQLVRWTARARPGGRRGAACPRRRWWRSGTARYAGSTGPGSVPGAPGTQERLLLTTPLVLHLIEVRAYADGAVLHVYRPAAG